MKFYKERGMWVCVYRGEKFIADSISMAAALAGRMAK